MVKKIKEEYIVYYKPGCSKCRTLVGAMDEAGKTCEYIEYLNHPPDEERLNFILEKTGLRAFDLIRTNEELYKNKFSGKKRTDKQWIKVLVKHPELLQRPIVVKGDKVWIARSEEAISSVLKG